MIRIDHILMRPRAVVPSQQHLAVPYDWYWSSVCDDVSTDECDHGRGSGPCPLKAIHQAITQLLGKLAHARRRAMEAAA